MAGWFMGLMAMTIFTLSFFPSFKNGSLGQAFNNLSPALQKIAGTADSFTTIGGYIDQQLFALRIPLLATILTIAIFSSLTAGEERRGLLETQLSLPLSRTKILFQKLLAGIFILVLAMAGVLIGVIIILLILNEYYSLTTVLKEILGALLVSLGFGLIAFMLGSGFGKKGLAIGLSSAFAFFSYLVSSLVVSVPALQGVERASLFHYQNPPVLTVGNGLVLGGVAVVVAAASFILFLRRDIGT